MYKVRSAVDKKAIEEKFIQAIFFSAIEKRPQINENILGSLIDHKYANGMF